LNGEIVDKYRIREGIEQEARRIAERKPMKKESDNTVYFDSGRAVISQLKAEGWTQAKIAKTIGVSTTAISNLVRGKGKDNFRLIAEKLAELYNSETRRQRRSAGKRYIETSVARGIHTLITQTDALSSSESKIGVIIGDAGHGKSVCLKEYFRANKNTIYAELDGAMTTTAIFSEIARKLTLDSSGIINSIARRLIDELQNRSMLVMLDEASYLTVDQLDKLRQIIVVKARCPLILTGNSDLHKTIMQNPNRRGYECLDQFTSRLSYILNLDDLAAQPGGGMYTAEEIRDLYQYGGLKLTRGAVESLSKIARAAKGGRLRTCDTIVAALHTCTAAAESGSITAEMLTAVIDTLNLPVRIRLPLYTETPDEQPEQKAITKAG